MTIVNNVDLTLSYFNPRARMGRDEPIQRLNAA